MIADTEVAAALEAEFRKAIIAALEQRDWTCEAARAQVYHRVRAQFDSKITRLAGSSPVERQRLEHVLTAVVEALEDQARHMPEREDSDGASPERGNPEAEHGEPVIMNKHDVLVPVSHVSRRRVIQTALNAVFALAILALGWFALSPRRPAELLADCAAGSTSASIRVGSL